MNWKHRHRARTIANCNKSAVDDLTAKAFTRSPRKAAEAGKETTGNPLVPPVFCTDSLTCWQGAETGRAGQPAFEPSYPASKDAAEDARMSDLGTFLIDELFATIWSNPPETRP